MLQVKNIEYTVRSQMGNPTKFKISNVNFTLEPGYIMCLLGKNGSGKSTLLQLLYGMQPVDQGSIQWHEQEVHSNSSLIRQDVAYIGEDTGFFKYRTIQENIEILGVLYPKFDYEEWKGYLKQFGLKYITKEQTFIELSTGQRRLIQLAFALARSPKLLLLDEPTANLDPVFRIELMDLLQKRIETQSMSVIISTHIMDEIEEITDYIGVMCKGEMVLFGDRESVLEQKNIASLDKLLE